MKAKELEDFLLHIMEVYTDQYGMLEICEDGDELDPLDPTVKRVVSDYLEKKEKEKNEVR